MSQPQLEVTTSDHLGSALVRVEGEIDLSTAPHLERELGGLSADPGKALIVDLRAVGFMDSTGIGVLVRTFKKLEAGGGSMALVCVAGPIRRVLEVSGVDGVMPVYGDLEAAAAG